MALSSGASPQRVYTAGTGNWTVPLSSRIPSWRMARTPFDMEYKWVVAVVFVCGMFLDIMDTTIVNVVLPSLQREFHTTTASIEWVVLGYLLSLAVWIPASGWIGDRMGTKRVFLFALAMFTIASALCGQAHSLSELVAFRVLQGVGGGMLVPVGTAMLFRAFPPIERAKASTVLIIPTVLAPATGPVVGGWLVTDVSWRWIFYVNLPDGGVRVRHRRALLARAPRGNGRAASMCPASCCSGAGLALVLYALSQGPEKGWRSPSVLVTGFVGAAAVRVAGRRRDSHTRADARVAALSANACSATPTSCSRSPMAASRACCSSCRCSCKSCAGRARCNRD